MTGRPLNGSNDAGANRATVLYGQYHGVRGDPEHALAVVWSVTMSGDEPSNSRSVPHRVDESVATGRLSRKVDAVEYVSSEIVVRGIHSAIDDGDDDPATFAISMSGRQIKSRRNPFAIPYRVGK
jgi:hypothetical protein